MKTMKRIIHHRYVVALVAVIALTSLSLAAPKKAIEKKTPMTGRDKWQQPDRVVADLGLKEGATVADVGCGSGYFTFRLSKAVGEKGKVFATEISDKGLKAVADRAKKNNITNIQTIKSDPTKTKLTRESVDAATIVNVLHHVPKESRAALVKDIAEAIRPGGAFFIIDWRVKADIKHDKTRRIARAALVGLAEGAGLKLDAEFFYLKNQVFLRFNKPAKIQAPSDGDKTTSSGGFKPLFDGKTLNGWKGRDSLWRVEDGAICGQTSADAKLKHNDFLYTVKEYGDFELTLKYRLVNHNSGVQIRSKVHDDFRVTGYQADIAEKRYTGILYEEGGRGIMADVKPAEVSKFIKKGEWNDYRIVCRGKEVKFWINGRPTISYTEKKDTIAKKGVIAFQLHAGPPMKVYFKDIVIKELPAGGKN